MFGLFQKRPRFKKDRNGRALPPDLGVVDTLDLKPKQIELASHWARSWVAPFATDHDTNKVFEDVSKCLSGAALSRKKTEHNRIVDMAVRQVRAQGRASRQSRTADTFDVCFKLGPSEQHCKAAVSAEGKVYKIGKEPSIPLPGCTAETCRCWYHGQLKPKNRRRRQMS